MCCARTMAITLDESTTAFNRQRGVTVRHQGRSFRWLDTDRVAWSLLILAAKGLPFLLPHPDRPVVNVLPRNI